MRAWITDLHSRLRSFLTWHLLKQTAQIVSLRRELELNEKAIARSTERIGILEMQLAKQPKPDPLVEAERLLRLAQELLAPPPDARPVNVWELRCWRDDYRQYLLERGQLHHEAPHPPGSFHRSRNGYGWMRE